MVAFISETRDVFPKVALEMVVLSNFEDEDDLQSWNNQQSQHHYHL